MAEVTGMTPDKINFELAKKLDKTQRDLDIARAGFYKGLLDYNTNILDITSSGAYFLKTYAHASTITTPTGKLPYVGAGVLVVIVEDPDRKKYTWFALNNESYDAAYAFGSFNGWTKRATKAEVDSVVATVNDKIIEAEGRFNSATSSVDGAVNNLKNEVESLISAAVTQSEDKLKTYTDVSFSASAADSSDVNLDAAIERAILSEKIQTSVVYPESFGAVGDGVTDDILAINNALSYCFDNKKVLFFRSKNYKITSKLITNTQVVYTDNTVFSCSGYADYSAVFSDDFTQFGEMTFVIPSFPATRGISISGNNVNLDRVNVEATSPTAGQDNFRRCGLMVRGSNVSVNRASVKNFENGMVIDVASNVNIKDVDINTYVTGIYVRDAIGLRVSGMIHGASPTASMKPGHNGVLIESVGSNFAVTDVYLTNLIVKDSGEHGFRIGGGLSVDRVFFNSCSAINTGASGFKALCGGVYKDGARHYGLTFDNCLAQDIGQNEANSAGILIHKCENVTVSNLKMSKLLKEHSGGTGIEIQGCDYVTINNCILKDAKIASIMLYDIRGSITNLIVDNIISRSPWLLKMDWSRDGSAESTSNFILSNSINTGGGVSIVGDLSAFTDTTLSYKCSGDRVSGVVPTTPSFKILEI